MNGFSHLNTRGIPEMVDISAKNPTARTAIAMAQVAVSQKIAEAIERNSVPKGNIFITANIAGIQGAKKCSELIPLTHNIPINKVAIHLWLKNNTVFILCKAVTTAKTGIEMEAVTGASIAALTIYDMCKGLDKNIVIKNTSLLYKSGGKSGEFISADFNAFKDEIEKI